ncbi:hypothetical protein U1Q18_031534, partial [Sarracenia purpurea var. burkii]
MSSVEQKKIKGENSTPKLRTEIRSSVRRSMILDPGHHGRGAWCRDLQLNIHYLASFLTGLGIR